MHSFFINGTFFDVRHIIYQGQIYKPEAGMKSIGRLCKVIGVAVFSFGVGILASFFLPDALLVVIEALIIISIGILYFCSRA